MSTVTAARMTLAGRAARASTEARNTKPSPPISRVESKKAQGASRRASLTRTRATDEKDAKTSIDDETVLAESIIEHVPFFKHLDNLSLIMICARYV